MVDEGDSVLARRVRMRLYAPSTENALSSYQSKSIKRLCRTNDNIFFHQQCMSRTMSYCLFLVRIILLIDCYTQYRVSTVYCVEIVIILLIIIISYFFFCTKLFPSSAPSLHTPSGIFSCMLTSDSWNKTFTVHALVDVIAHLISHSFTITCKTPVIFATPSPAMQLYRLISIRQCVARGTNIDTITYYYYCTHTYAPSNNYCTAFLSVRRKIVKCPCSRTRPR